MRDFNGPPDEIKRVPRLTQCVIGATLPRMTVETRTIEALNPATGERIGEVRAATPEEVRHAVARAREAARAWAGRPVRERAAALRAMAGTVLARRGEIAQILVRSCGKPVAEAVAQEVVPVAILLDYFGRHAPRWLAPERIRLGPFDWMGRRSWLERRPLGVVAIIAPWNYPFSIPMGEIAAALVAGNGVVFKPSEITPLVGETIREIVSAHVPEGLFHVVQGAGDVGAALIEARPDKIVFTGSVATGRRIMRAAADGLTPVVLELGGKDAMIVFADADLETAAAGAVWGAFMNAGQVCASVERLYVERAAYEEFVGRVVERAQRLRQGDPTDPETDIGALTCAMQIDKVEEQVEDAVRRGARVRCGGRRLDRPGFWFPPTVLTDVPPEARILREETFGPVVVAAPFETEDEAVRQANATPFGLTASVWSRDLRRARRVAARLRAGTVQINDCASGHGIGQAPWGGMGESGFGRVHGKWGVWEMTVPVHVHENRWTHARAPWWHPYSARTIELMTRMAEGLTGGPRRLLRWLLSVRPSDLDPRSHG